MQPRRHARGLAAETRAGLFANQPLTSLQPGWPAMERRAAVLAHAETNRLRVFCAGGGRRWQTGVAPAELGVL